MEERRRFSEEATNPIPTGGKLDLNRLRTKMRGQDERRRLINRRSVLRLRIDRYTAELEDIDRRLSWDIWDPSSHTWKRAEHST